MNTIITKLFDGKIPRDGAVEINTLFGDGGNVDTDQVENTFDECCTQGQNGWLRIQVTQQFEAGIRSMLKAGKRSSVFEKIIIEDGYQHRFVVPGMDGELLGYIGGNPHSEIEYDENGKLMEV